MGKSGRYLTVQVDGTIIHCVTVGGLAAAVNRSPRTIRGWERSGLIPAAPLVLPGEQNTRRRLYPVLLVAAIKEVATREGFGRRRPSGIFLNQQKQIGDAWQRVMLSLISEHSGVIEEEGT
jgi:hypothetical protein